MGWKCSRKLTRSRSVENSVGVLRYNFLRQLPNKKNRTHSGNLKQESSC